MTSFDRILERMRAAAPLSDAANAGRRLLGRQPSNHSNRAVTETQTSETVKRGHKRALVLDSDSDSFHPSTSDSEDPDPIVVRRPKRLRPNPSLNLATPSATSSLNSTSKRNLRRRSLTPFFPIGVTWEEYRRAYNKARPARRIFERDFPRYNQALNKAYLQSKTRPESQGRDYVPVYLSDSTVTPGHSTPESSLEPISDEELFGTTVQPVEFDPLTSTQKLRVPNSTPEPKPCQKKCQQV